LSGSGGLVKQHKQHQHHLALAFLGCWCWCAVVAVAEANPDTLILNMFPPCYKAPREAKSKKGHHYSVGNKGGFFATLKIKKRKYYEIRRQGKTKLSHTFSENKLKFNLKRQEFT
jgi:hypothetical protein